MCPYYLFNFEKVLVVEANIDMLGKNCYICKIFVVKSRIITPK